MMRRVGLVLLWGLAAFLAVVCANICDPYLVALRGQGKFVLLAVSFVMIGLLAIFGAFRRKGIAGKLLVLIWFMPPLALAYAEVTFHQRKQSVLRADSSDARTLGRHFVVGYSSFDEIAPLAARGLIGGVYVTQRNIKGTSAAALKAEIATMQDMRRAAGLPPLIVAADQEGGIVSHLSPQLTALPALAALAKLPPEQRARTAESFG